MFAPDLSVAREAAKAEMLKGGIWVIAGGLITGVTYLSANPDGSYIVFWAAIAYGAFRVLRAAVMWLYPDALLKR